MAQPVGGFFGGIPFKKTLATGLPHLLNPVTSLPNTVIIPDNEGILGLDWRQRRGIILER